MTHVIVTDLGYGDAGKGSVTDWLCSSRGTALRGERPAAAVVRFNGGSQAGHNVTDGRRHHTFAQFGSGTFRGIPTFLSCYMLLDPLALAAEDAHLIQIGLGSALDLLAVDRDALVITPYHIAVNKARELARGDRRHGSCGKGIGETASFAIRHPGIALRAGDCLNRREMYRKLGWIRLVLAEEAGEQALRDVPAREDIMDAYQAFASRVALVDGRYHLARLLRQGPVVFEGAQGVLLDERSGFHPYTTWSATTAVNARTLLAEAGQDGYVLGVTRAYMTRHGAGPLVTEDPALDFPEPHNTTDQWQGAFRQGHPDALALDYAVRVNGGIDGLAVTHLDTVARRWLKLCDSYREPYGSVITRLNPVPDRDEGLTRTLMRATPVYAEEPVRPDTLAHDLSWVAKAPLVLRSYGPGADAKQVSLPETAQAARA